MHDPRKSDSEPLVTPGDGLVSGVIRREAVEDIAESVKQFYNLDVAQLEPGTFRTQIDFIAGNEILLYREHYPRRTHVCGELLGGRFGIAIPDRPPGRGEFPATGKSSGITITDTRLPSALPDESLDYLMEGGFGHTIALVDQSKLLKMAGEACLSEASLKSLLPGRNGSHLASRPHAVGRARRALRHLLDSVPGGRLKLTGRDFETAVYNSILSSIEETDRCPDRPNQAAFIVRRALEIADSAQGPSASPNSARH